MNRSFTTRLLIVSLTFALCGLPEAIAQTAAKPLPDAPSARRLVALNLPAPQNPDATQVQDPAQQPPPSDQQPVQPAEQQDAPQPRVVPVDPQKAPGTEEQPQPDAATSESQDASSSVSTQDEPTKTLPPADPAELQQLESAQQQNAPEQTPKVNERVNPLGTAAAEKGKTAGGGASRPAGVAIAPAKQKRSRSLLIKVGAALAAGAALGTVYGLSRSTKSTPAGAVR